MAVQKSLGWFRWPSYLLFSRKESSDDEPSETPETSERYLQLTVKCMKRARKMPDSLNFNDGQCKYLVDKLEVAVQSVHTLRFDHAGLAHYFQVFKFLFSLATEVESFIEICCKVAWIQAAVSMTDVSKHVCFLGFNLEVFGVIFSKCTKQNGTRALTSTRVAEMSKAEVEIVKYKASLDEMILLRKLEDFLRSSSSGKRSEKNDRQLAGILVERLRQSSTPNATLESSFFDLGKYSTYLRQKEQLGKGASAIVFKAIWLGVTVAKKTFDGAQNSSFKTELSNFARLSHPNIVRLFGYETHVRKCSIVMELMDGDLCQLIDERLDHAAIHSSPFTIMEAIDIMHQIGEGALYLHEHKIVHRDLKSANILFKRVKARETKTEYVHVKVADLGVSKMKERSRTSSKQTQNVGTSRWMAPEMISMNSEPVSMAPEVVSSPPNSLKYPFKIDVYSFALIGYQILSGLSPFSSISDEQPKELKKLVLAGRRPPEFEDKESPFHGCPARLKTLIEKCWNEDPGARPSFRDICEDLRYLKCLLIDHLIGSPSRFRGVISVSSIAEPDPVAEVTAIARNSKTEIGRGKFGRIYYEDLPDRQEVPVVVAHGSHRGFTEFLNNEGHLLLVGVKMNAELIFEALDHIRLVNYVADEVCVNKNQCKRLAERFCGIDKALVALMTEHNADTFIEISTMDQIVAVLKKGHDLVRDNADERFTLRNVLDEPPRFTKVHEEIDALGVFLDIDETKTNESLDSDAEIHREESQGMGDGDLSYPNIPFSEIKGLSERKSQARAHRDGPALLHEGIWNGWNCAIKVFKSAENSEELHKEIASLVKLRHPCVTQLIGCAQDDGKTYVLTEMMDSNLRAVMTSRKHERPFSRTKELSIMTQIADGMFYLHEKGLVHGELKCSNLLVREVGDDIDVKIGNFHWRTNSRQLRQAPTSNNDSGEASDELLLKRDVLSFAMTCYEVVTGKNLFDGVEGKAVEEEIKAGARPKLPKDLNKDLKRLITKCWHEDPKHRPSFQDICYVLKALKVLEVDAFTYFLGYDEWSDIFCELLMRPLQEIDHASKDLPHYLKIRPSDLKSARLLGMGASAEIYEASWIGCKFAVKWFKVDQVAKFRQEVKIMMKMVHPHVIRLVGFSVHFMRVAIVMELMGGSLRDLMDHRIRASKEKYLVPFSESEALGVITQVALGMDFLHSRGVAHGDLKCAHVMVVNVQAESTLVVKLVDFGSSHLESQIESKPSAVGRCLAPEVIVSMDSRYPVPYDPKPADVFSFGMVCLEVITGKEPYHDVTSDMAEVLVKAGATPKLDSINVSKALKDLLEACWCLEPQKRLTFHQICEHLAAMS